MIALMNFTYQSQIKYELIVVYTWTAKVQHHFFITKIYCYTLAVEEIQRFYV